MSKKKQSQDETNRSLSEKETRLFELHAEMLDATIKGCLMHIVKVIETLDENWHSYVDFHLNKLGCHYCQASLEDLQRQTAENKTSGLHVRIMESTVGFLHKP